MVMQVDEVTLHLGGLSFRLSHVHMLQALGGERLGVEFVQEGFEDSPCTLKL